MEHTQDLDWEEGTGGYFVTNINLETAMDLLKYVKKDIAEMILLKLDHSSLKEACEVSKEVQKICSSDQFKRKHRQLWGHIKLEDLVRKVIKKHKLGKFRKATLKDVQLDGGQLDIFMGLSANQEEYEDPFEEMYVSTDGKDNWYVQVYDTYQLFFKPEKDGMRYGIELLAGNNINELFITPEGKGGYISEYDIKMPAKYRDITRGMEYERWNAEFQGAVEYFKKLSDELNKK